MPDSATNLYEIPVMADLVELAQAFKSEGEPPTFQDLVGEDWPDELVAEVYLMMQQYQRAAKVALDALGAELGDRLGDRDTGIQVMDTWITYKPRVTSRVTNIEGFWEYMLQPEHLSLIPKAFNPNSLRKTGIPPSVLDTFFERVEVGSPKVTDIPVHVLDNKKGGIRSHDRN